MKTTLGPLETRLLAYAHMRRVRVLSIADLTGPLRFTRLQAREVLSRMKRGGMIARVRRGLYLIPPRLPLGGRWGPDDILVLDALMRDSRGRYQICGPNAFNRYGFETQIPTRTYAYNNRLSGDRKIGSVSLTLIEVADNRLGATEKFKRDDGLKAVYSSRERTLVDAVYDWSRFNTLPRAYEWIWQELASNRVDAADLIQATVRFGNRGTIRRIGLVLERARVAPRLLEPLRRAAGRSSSVIPLVPNAPARGAMNGAWGIIENDRSRAR